MTQIQNTENTKCWAERGEIKNCHSLLAGMENGIVTLEDRLAIS
jgi:hypothetical protein